MGAFGANFGGNFAVSTSSITVTPRAISGSLKSGKDSFEGEVLES